MYNKEQKSAALEIFDQTNSISETIRIWGYPTRKQLYTWIATENMYQKILVIAEPVFINDESVI